MLSPLSKSEVKERDTAAHGQALKHREKRTLVDVPGTALRYIVVQRIGGSQTMGFPHSPPSPPWVLTGAAL